MKQKGFAQGHTLLLVIAPMALQPRAENPNHLAIGHPIDELNWQND